MGGMPASFDYGKPGPFRANLDDYREKLGQHQELADHLTLLRSNFDQIFADWRQYGFNDLQISLMLGVACGNRTTADLFACMAALEHGN